MTIILTAIGIGASMYFASKPERHGLIQGEFILGIRSTVSTAYEVFKSQKCWRPEITYNTSKIRELKSKSMPV